MIRTYHDLVQLPTFKERFDYLSIGGRVGEETFGFDRYLNQVFYHSKEWRQLRDEIIVRDDGCDLGIPDRTIFGKILIHHMNPIRKEDVLNRSDFLLNPEFLISVSMETHTAIHYGDFSLITSGPIVRKKNDTCPWRQ